MAGFTCSVCTFVHQFTAQRCQMCGALRVTKGQMREFVKTGKIEAGESTKQKQSGHGRRDGRSSSKPAPAKSSATTKKRSSSLPAPSKRQKVNHDSKTSHEAGGVPTPASRVIGDARPKSKGRNNQAEHASGRLILCKRWTVASSNSPRGRVRYNEALQFHRPKNTANSGGGAAAKPIDPIVRFRSASGSGDGTLNRYLSSILSPLLWHDASSHLHPPMVTLEATCLMEETLVMGSEIPISLHVYVNDPHAFFGLFDDGDDASNSSLFFGRKGAGLPSSGKMPSYQGKRARSSFSRDELAEAAFHLLQWAEKGEEMPFEVKTTSDDGEGQGTEEFTDNEEKDGGDNAEESEEVNELNQLVASDDGKQVKSLPELSDPTGFKPDVVLRPYQRQALHFMCQREGCHIEGEMDGDSAAQGGEDEMALLAELAGQIRDGQSSMPPSGDEPVACDCGPVLVDGTIASSASPVCYHGRTGAINGKAFVHHPLWKRRFLATDDLRTVYSFYVNELLGVASATPPNAPEPAVGGILADAMGLGKTVELLSLILKSKEALNSSKEIKPPPVAQGSDEVVDLLDDSDSESSSMDDDEEWTEESEKRDSAAKKKTVTSQRRTKGTTLVVAPLSLVSQWEDEIATKTDLSQIVYYDSSKKLAGCDSFSSVDVVVTTYGTLQSEYVALSKTGMSMQPNHTHPLLKFSWQRVILDEAHGIKNPATVVSKACCLLQAKSRWCVTGTPIQNSLQDVYGLLKFLRHEPWCEANFWKSAITDTLSSSESSDDKAGGQDEDDRSPHELAASAAFARVRRVLAPVIIRRTKDTLTEDGKPILTLPPVDSSVVKVNLSPDEREFYDALLERSQSVFDGFVKAGTANKSWFAIFSLLQRLRQSCDHVSLTVSRSVELPGLKKSAKDTGHEPTASSDGSDNAVDDKFLTGLLSKFKMNAKSGSSSEPSDSYVKGVAESLTQCVQSNDGTLDEECPICLEVPTIEEAVHLPCGHMFKRDCLLSTFEDQLARKTKGASKKKQEVTGGNCPTCDVWFNLSEIVQIKKNGANEMVSKFLSPARKGKENNAGAEASERAASARETLESSLRGASSAKLCAILDELDAVWRLDPGSKVLIFSQYLGFLDIIGSAVQNLGVECFRIDGKMSLKERVAMLGRFNKKCHGECAETDGLRRGSVFLVSMKAGGVGLNLVAASSVFIVDPWWNAAIEDQCINRIHRIGQKAERVRVRKFIVTDSVEEKIANLQHKKKGMATSILDESGGGELDGNEPTLDDFKLLFGRAA